MAFMDLGAYFLSFRWSYVCNKNLSEIEQLGGYSSGGDIRQGLL